MTIEELLQRVEVAKQMLRMVGRIKWDAEDASSVFSFAANVDLRIRSLANNLEKVQ